MLDHLKASWANLRAQPAGQRFQLLRASYGAEGWLRELLLFAALGCFTIAAAMFMTGGPTWLFLMLAAALVVTQSYTAARWLDLAEVGLRGLLGQAPEQDGHDFTTTEVMRNPPNTPAPQPRSVVMAVADAEPVVWVTPPPEVVQPRWRTDPHVTPQPSAAASTEAQATVVKVRTRAIGGEQPRRATLKLGVVPARSS